ncbi:MULTISPECIES: AI-2E family transporter [Legionella]|uniref:AI-2E family transporter n=1 Tax=Legionella septentrionalis TaxID=2498109 RepID=A0A3S0XS16_9GAMM|nr:MULTISPECIES: AI-2E family transporter [Legionella]MCP0913156.1 AI-2E family transporter [Legionella sp. 27cVA30]RUQ81564.1 AI-2E family transporter [Legionella septentrionalis]RUR02459.1 AI-2E family transporter [Legionella septentrionalis]RUR09316.1 AI-2E family transporter [Legionella septentrionalis]RUR17117.1 AI-2E family transporter [Legionella septentrionalis]
MNRTITFAAGLLTVWLIGYLLIAGRGILIPLIIALFIWNFLNTIYNAIERTPLVGARLPNWLSMLLAFVIVAVLGSILVHIISNNVNEVITASPRYQENLSGILNRLDARYGIKTMMTMDGIFKDLNMQALAVNIYGVFTTLTSSAVLISLYIVFLFVEQHYFRQKMNALFPQLGHRQLVDSILSHIVKDTQTYLGLKTLLSLITATASWIIMKLVDLDFAEFWALLIFFLNYIPNIGAILATAFPALLALIQFTTWLPFIIVTSGIILVQFIIGNIVEPRFLSKSLNLSPLVILIALGFWGSIWGVLGMFLSVPITVMMMIIFAHFDATRPIAILLSQDGYVKRSYEAIE